jgi:DNA-binding PadR family transcriptional regulator
MGDALPTPEEVHEALRGAVARGWAVVTGSDESGDPVYRITDAGKAWLGATGERGQPE